MHDDPLDPRPHSRLTARVRRDVLVDRAAYRLVTSRVGRPDPALLQRIDDEVAEALPLFQERGWIDQPETYHQEPPTPTGVRTARKRSGNLRFTSLSWIDGYEPRAEEPGADRADRRASGLRRISDRTGRAPASACRGRLPP